MVFKDNWYWYYILSNVIVNEKNLIIPQVYAWKKFCFTSFEWYASILQIIKNTVNKIMKECNDKMKSSSIKYNHIAIEGNIGLGKTT